MRVTASGLVAPRQVLVATWLAFGVAVAVGAYLIALVGWELLAIGAASILAGVLYTGGPRPYGYEGLGELFVFLFFGIVAVVGSYYVQTEELRALAFELAVPVGLLAAVDPDGQQHPRHRHRPPRRQANARGAPRPASGRAGCMRSCSCSPSPTVGLIVVTGEGEPWLLLSLALGAACAAAGPDGRAPAPTGRR